MKTDETKGEYPKIQSVFLRDPANRMKTFLMGEYTTPEFEYLADLYWLWTEKVDGTNVRVQLYPNHGAVFKGRTETSELPDPLVAALNKLFIGEEANERTHKAFPYTEPITLYGEGYGPKIQKGGGNYRKDPSFVLFDVKVGDWWLKRTDVADVAFKLGLGVVPVVKVCNIADAVKVCEDGFRSTWGDFVAEGLVGIPLAPMFARNGDRIITKVKCKDFG